MRKSIISLTTKKASSIRGIELAFNELCFERFGEQVKGARSVSICPALTGSKWGNQLPVKSRLVKLVISGGWGPLTD